MRIMEWGTIELIEEIFENNMISYKKWKLKDNDNKIWIDYLF